MHIKRWLNVAVVCVMVITLLAACATGNRPDNNVAPSPTRGPGTTGPGVNNVGPNDGWNDGNNMGTRSPGPGVNNTGPNNGWNDATNAGRNGAPGTMGPGANGNGWNNGNGNVGTRANNNMRLADDIADKLGDMREINNATVMLTDDNAFVAVDMPGNRQGDLTNDLKKRISRNVKKMDKSVDNVYVSADADFFDRMGTYARDIRNGDPIQGMAEQVTETLRRIFPTAY